jgi:hypothetical protein
MDELADAFEEFEDEGGAVGAPRTAKVRGDPESPEALVEAANASPFFSDAFRAAFEDAQGRIAESKKEETAKINAEVEEIWSGCGRSGLGRRYRRAPWRRMSL